MALKSKITEFIHGLISYDYILFSISFTLFILFIVLGIVLRKKLFFATIFILLGFLVLLLGPSLGYIKMHEYLFKNSVIVTSVKKLNFTPALVLKGKITNESKKNFTRCRITANVYKVTSNKWKNYIKKLKPFKKMSISLENLEVSQTKEFKMIIEPFTYEKDYNISLGADCQ